MKKLRLLIVAVMLFIGITSSFAQKKEKVIKEVTYTCSLDCHACEEKIMKNVPYEQGVKNVKVDLENKQVTVSFREDKTSQEMIKKALEDLGYTTEIKKSATEKTNKKDGKEENEKRK